MRFLFTAAAQRALDAAADWSLRRECDELEAESLLLGLLAEPECRAAVMLARVGVNVSIVRKQWAELTPRSPSDGGVEKKKSFSADVVCSLQLASGLLSRSFQTPELATEHILLGLASADHDVSVWLGKQGIDPDALATEIRQLHGIPEEDFSCIEPDDPESTCEDSICEGGTSLSAAKGVVLPLSTPFATLRDVPPNVNVPPDVAALRIIDAAANRAREAVRVIEDYARMALDDKHLTELCKQFRHDLTDCLTSINSRHLISARETQFDVGTTLGLPAESRRENFRDVLRANFARLQEALRTIEEYGKLSSCWGGSCTATPGAAVQLPHQPRELAAAAKRLRYDSYTLQRAMEITAVAIERLASARLYVLIDGRDTPEEFEQLARSLIAAGVDVLQLRDKRLGDRELLARARLLVKLVAQPPSAVSSASNTAEGGCATYKRVLAIINDRPDLAALAGADGVHVGQEEISVKDARRIVGPDSLVGVSTHSIEQARRAVLDGADYIGVGPVFPSETKHFERFPGVELVRDVAEEIGLPAFAIGGINISNIAEVLSVGATRVAIGGAIASADDPAGATKELSLKLKH